MLDRQLGWLESCPDLDTGVHLNLTSGTPVSNAMRHRLRPWGGQFIKKERMFGALLRGVVTVADVRVEWQSQIEQCLAHGLRPRFLNSHEHMHMWPPLFALIHELASAYAIEHVRYPLGELPQRWTTGSVARNAIIHALAWLNRKRRTGATIPCLGVGESGRLSFDYLRHLVSVLERGRVYELLCHPGYDDPDEIKDRRLRSYHDWEQELSVLTDEATLALFARHGVRLVGYRRLSTSEGRLCERVDGVAERTLEVVARELAVQLHVPDHRLDRRAPTQPALDRGVAPRRLPATDTAVAAFAPCPRSPRSTHGSGCAGPRAGSAARAARAVG